MVISGHDLLEDRVGVDFLLFTTSVFLVRATKDFKEP